MTLGGFPGGIYGGIGQLGARAQAGPLPWYLSGGIAAGNCMAAYAPKGAASAAASYVNLANPGTFDLTVGKNLGTLAWDAVNGLKLDLCVMATGLNLAGTNKQWSVLLRFSDVLGYNFMLGAYAGWYDSFAIYRVPLQYGFRSSGYETYNNSSTFGVIAIAGNKGYWNGSAVVTINNGSAVNAGLTNFGIGGWKTTTDWDVMQRLYVQAFAAYDTPITDAQVAAVSAAMAAL